jgi:hypothetical protein
VLTAVDGNIGPGHECRFIGSEVGDEAGDFFRLAQAIDRDLRQNF